MKTTELTKSLRQALRARDRMPLSEDELWLDSQLHLAVMGYEDRVRLGHPAAERRCMICEKPLSQCYC